MTQKLLELAADAPLPVCQALIPLIVDVWNGLKGGVDVYSRLVSVVQAFHPSMKIHGKLLLRNFATLLVNCHLTSRFFRLEEELEGKSIRNSFDSFTLYKKRLNKMDSFEDTLYEIAEAWPGLRPFADIEVPVATLLLAANDVNGADVDADEPSAEVRKTFKGRSLWERDPSFAKYRLSTRKTHKSTSAYQEHAPAGQPKAKRTLRRCIVCCSACIKGNNHTYRSGYKVRTWLHHLRGKVPTV